MSGMVLTAGEKLAIPMRYSCGTSSSGQHCMSVISILGSICDDLAPRL